MGWRKDRRREGEDGRWGKGEERGQQKEQQQKEHAQRESVCVCVLDTVAVLSDQGKAGCCSADTHTHTHSAVVHTHLSTHIHIHSGFLYLDTVCVYTALPWSISPIIAIFQVFMYSHIFI